MDKVYLHIETTNNGFNLKSYTSFNRLCKENNIDNKKVSKNNLPFKVGNIIVMESVVNTKI
jgi:hypothetical protein